MKSPRLLAWLSMLWTTAFWLGCVAVPVGFVLARAGSVSLFRDPAILATAQFTLKQAFWSAGLSALIGLPLGLLSARASGRLAQWIDTMLLLPSAVPTVVAATAWVVWLGRSGILARFGLKIDLAYSLQAVVLAHVFFNAPWIALLVAQTRRTLPSAPLEAALTLGASRWARFRWVIWPELRWTFAAACVQVLALCAMSFALVMILGGGPPVETLETAIYSRIRYGSLDLSGAAACAVWELLITLVPWVAVLWLRSRDGGAASKNVQAPLARRERRGWTPFALLVLGALFLVPYLAVFTGELARLADSHFRDEILEPLQLSLLLASATGVGTLLTAALAVTAASLSRKAVMRAFVAALLALPSGVSVLVLGLGVWLAYGRWLDPFSGSLSAMALVQITAFFPVAFRMLWPLAQATPRAPMEAAITLGASPWRAFWIVDWPRWRGPTLSVLALVIGGALGEVAAVSLFYSENLIPLPLLVSRFMGQYRFEEARVVAALLLVISGGAVIAVSWLSGGWRKGVVDVRA